MIPVQKKEHPTGKMRGVLREAAVYAVLLAAAALIYLFVHSIGMRMPMPARQPANLGALGGPQGGHDAGVMLHVLIALSIVVAVARAGGVLFSLMRQPAVVGEIIAGILLGPSLLGQVWPAGFGYILPSTVAPFLNVLAQLGIILYMFLVGLELDPQMVARQGRSAVAISHASIVVPFLLGTMLALVIYPRESVAGIPFTGFSLFMGLSMSVTAFPVLSRMLNDMGLSKTPLGVTALTSAAVDDVTAWCLLAVVVGIVEARGSHGLITIVMSITYIAFMILLVRPPILHLTTRQENAGTLTQTMLAVVFVLLLTSAFTTEWIGIHAMFGAFALGALIPSDSKLARQVTERLEDVLLVLLLPTFFALTGLRTRIGLVSGREAWLLCGVVILVATVGKFSGAFVAARFTGHSWRDASALGVLMNTRGMAELIVLNIGLQIRVINPRVFAMLVIMSLVTTLMTAPLLHLLAPSDKTTPRAEGGAQRMPLNAVELSRRLMRQVPEPKT
jgi:Kef-type K+ transport system membrane component KefB